MLQIACSKKGQFALSSVLFVCCANICCSCGNSNPKQRKLGLAMGLGRHLFRQPLHASSFPDYEVNRQTFCSQIGNVTRAVIKTANPKVKEQLSKCSKGSLQCSSLKRHRYTGLPVHMPSPLTELSEQKTTPSFSVGATVSLIAYTRATHRLCSFLSAKSSMGISFGISMNLQKYTEAQLFFPKQTPLFKVASHVWYSLGTRSLLCQTELFLPQTRG